jgi:hypothetical protein
MAVGRIGRILGGSAARSRGAPACRAGLASGGKDKGAPGLRPDYSPTCCAAFLIDPDGNNVEAICCAAA